jgi:DNA-binding LacI/PurR family transcriptional regulator
VSGCHGTRWSARLLTGFNAFAFRASAQPPLTSARAPVYEMGEAGAGALLGPLETGAFANAEIVFPVALVEGETG